MKLVGVLVLVLMFGVFCGAALGDDWDNFDGNDSGSSSVDVGVNVNTEGADVVGVKDYDGDSVYTRDFYIALGIGGLGVLIVAIFLYFFFRKPKNRWEKKKGK